MDVTIAGTAIAATVAGTTITATISETVTSVSVASNGAQGAPGASGIVSVTSPITNTGTAGSALIGIDQTLLSITPSQVVGTAVTLTSGTIQKTQVNGTAVTLADTGTVTNAMLNKSTVTFNGQTVSLGGTATITIATADYATLAGTSTYATTSGSATSAGTALTAGTASYALTSGTSTFATTSGTATYATTSGTSTYATTSGTATYATAAGTATTAGTATYATTSGTAAYATTSGTATYATTSGTATYATTAGTAVNISGTIAPSQVTGTAAVLGANTFTDMQTVTPATSATALIINAAASAVGLIVKLGSSGTSDLTQWQDNAGTTTVAKITSTGFFHGRGLRIKNGTATTSGVQASIEPEGTTVVGLLIRGIASQTADLQQWQNSGGTSVAKVAAAGAVTLSPTTGVALTANGVTDAVTLIIKGGASNTSDLQQWQNSAATVLTKIDSAGALTLSPSAGVAATITQVSGAIGLIIKNNGSSNIQEWQDSAGTTILARVSSSGSILGAGRLSVGQTLSAAGQMNVSVSSATLIGSIITAASSQTADLTQWQASGGTIIGGRNALAQIFTGSTAPISVATGGAVSGTSSGTTATLTTASAHGLAVGDIVVIAGITPTGYNGTYLVATVPSTTTFTVTTSGSNLGASTVSGTVSAMAQTSITARSAGTVPLVVRGAASQAARAFRVETSGATETIFMTSGGTISFGSGLGSATAENSGGQFILTRATAAATNPGANKAALYFVAGTNANTLKLVVRAGTAGAETTILDNIPTA